MAFLFLNYFLTDRVVQKIGSGGFGTVYRAIENCSKKQVCLKIVRLAQKVDFGEVLREA